MLWFFFFFFNDTATTEIYTLSLHDALPISRRTAEAGFAGVERFIGIPGTVGGGVFMNAGAHGAEFAEVLTERTVMDARGKIRQIPRKQISFKYRASNLGNVVLLEAKLALIEEPP